MVFGDLIISESIKAIRDKGLIEFLHFTLDNFFHFKNIAKLILVPIFKLEFDVFQPPLQKEHFSALNRPIFRPPFVNIAGEIRVREPDIFKPKRFVPWCTHKSGF